MKASSGTRYRLSVKFSRETDGRWIADIPDLPGVTVYGDTKKEAHASAEALALRVIAEMLEHGETLPDNLSVTFAA